MPLTNPWLAGPAPERELPRERLEERILNLLSTQNMAVIATVNADGSPAATPVRFLYTEHWLRRDGFKPRQIWRPAGPDRSVSATV